MHLESCISLFPIMQCRKKKKLGTVVLQRFEVTKNRQCYFAKDNLELWDSTSDLFGYVMGK